jgi:hypothetical protein
MRLSDLIQLDSSWIREDCLPTASLRLPEIIEVDFVSKHPSTLSTLDIAISNSMLVESRRFFHFKAFSSRRGVS